MKDMIKAERTKIMFRKPTKILFFAGVILILAFFFLFMSAGARAQRGKHRKEG